MNTEINKIIATVFKSTQNILNGMAPKDRQPTKEIVAQVAEETGISLSITTGLVSLYIENIKDAVKSAGRSGGVKKSEINAPSTIEACNHCGSFVINTPSEDKSLTSEEVMN